MYPVRSAHERGPTRVLAFKQDVVFLVKLCKVLYSNGVSSEYLVRFAQVCRQIRVLAGTCTRDYLEHRMQKSVLGYTFRPLLVSVKHPFILGDQVYSILKAVVIGTAG